MTTATTEPTTYKNRIANYLDPEISSGNGNIGSDVKSQGYGGDTCEKCQYQGLGWCRRFPQRVWVKNEHGFLEACGEYKPVI